MRYQPVGIGGVGGSGTRVVAELIKRLGIFIGSNLNGSNDNLSFPPLLDIAWRAEDDAALRTRRARQAVTAFADDMVKSFEREGSPWIGWGWKAPGTYYWLEEIDSCFDRFAYIHVIRHGLEMAMSDNTNQVFAWGPRFGIDAETMPMEEAQLRYWVAANELAVDSGNAVLGERFYLLNFNRLCEQPFIEVTSLCDFLGIEGDVEALASFVEPPASLGRHRSRGAQFPSDLVDAVERLGFAC